ncbi:GntR family transcriptional regulator [Sphingobium jiangsuense]|uniref:GntR family transcriptional regulator n=1 Tax=Sphingobium jiangsuense TaxID=870476 RepID=UPI00165EA3F3
MPRLSLVPPTEGLGDDKLPNLTSSVYQSLRADLLSGVFPAGVRLGIRALQERYGTGATPISA